MSEPVKYFLQLLRSALHADCPPLQSLDGQPLDEQTWEEIFALAKKHAVIGVVFDAAMSLPVALQPPRRIKVRMALMAEKIVAKNRAMAQRTAPLFAALKDMGLHACLLKGQSLAMLYPKPELRQCGDIDVWVEGDCKDTLAKIQSKWATGEVWYHHVDVKAFPDKLTVEVHFYPSWMNSPVFNRRLHEYFSACAPAQFSNYNEALGCCVPTTGFNLVFNMIHIYRHLLLEGIGLRQLLDYAFVLRSSDRNQRDDAMRTLHKLGIGDFVPSVMHIMKECFHLDDELLLCAPESRGGAFLLEEVLTAGNFGKTDSRNKWRHGQNRLQKAVHRFQHLSRFVMYAPSEVLWAPCFKVWQFFWKKINRFK